jgi:chemotaxis response regulator CheB
MTQRRFGSEPWIICGVAAVRGNEGVTMAQSEATSLYFDMPRAAIDLGGSQIRFSPHKIAEALCAVGL